MRRKRKSIMSMRGYRTGMSALVRLLCTGVLGAAAAVYATGGVCAADRPRLSINEAYVEETLRATELGTSDPLSVLAFVLESLPDRVKVYPTENYYYFRFTHNGTPYAGSIRLPPGERDEGKIEFGYYKDLTEWSDAIAGDVHLIAGPAQGLEMERLDRFAYRLTYRNKSVVFMLNDLSDVHPPAAALGADEKFLGPIFDESGVRFFLLFNTKLKLFHYVLDETARLADELSATAGADRILVGRRTGFAFYRDHLADRKILIGVYEGNSRINNYFDGPFDQLPENFIQGDELRDAIVASDPSVKGQLDRLGNYLHEEGRFLIHPYMLYHRQSDLQTIHTCAARSVGRPAAYYRCFVTSLPEESVGKHPPARRNKR
jgi:hypothetical protein